MTTEGMSPRPRSMYRRRAIACLVTAVIALTVALLPQLASSDLLRDRILQNILGDEHLVVESGEARFSWREPLTIKNLRIRNINGGFEASATEIRTQKSWLDIWKSSPDLGSIDIDQPVVSLVLESRDSTDESEDEAESVIDFLPTANLNLSDGRLLIRNDIADAPVVNASHLDLFLQMTTENQKPTLTIEGAASLADHEPLDESDFDDGLQLVAPQFSGEIGMSGSYSLVLSRFAWNPTESNSESSMSIEGNVVVHSVQASLKNDVTRRLVAAAADLMELESIPTDAQLIDESNIRFRWDGSGIWHESDFRMLPKITPGFLLHSVGSIGLDEQLDVQLTARLPLSLFHDSELAEALSESALRLQLTGNIQQPVLSTLPNQPWEELAKSVLTSDSSPDQERQYAREILHSLQALSPPKMEDAEPTSSEGVDAPARRNTGPEGTAVKEKAQ